MCKKKKAIDEDLHEGWKNSQSLLAAEIAAVEEDNLCITNWLQIEKQLEVETIFSAEDDGQGRTTKKINKTEMIKKTQC